MLLLKQDQLSLLEKQLDDVDASEDTLLYLGCNRKDGNIERTMIVAKLETALRQYG